MTTDQLQRHIAAMERARTASNAHVLDPAIARMLAALAARTAPAAR